MKNNQEKQMKSGWEAEPYGELTLYEYEQIKGIENEEIHAMVLGHVIPIQKEIDMLERATHSFLDGDELDDFQVNTLLNTFQKKYDLTLKKKKVIAYFQKNLQDNFIMRHSNRVKESDIRNLKSQIEKLKKDRKEPFLTEEQIKCFG